jgi:hypothetical protein
MKIKIATNIFFLLLLCIIFNGCTEPYILETNTYEEALVVEATITNEFKKQEITLTKTSRFEDKETQIESGADVFITDNNGTRYDFEEVSGKYISTIEFQAIPGKQYRLNINTKDGRTIESTPESLSNINPIQDVIAAVETKDSLRGVAIRVTSVDPTNEAKYYRYEYEETYKIIAPKWVMTKAIIGDSSKIILVPNPENTKVCYSTIKNTEILLSKTTQQINGLLNSRIRFINDKNYIITHRYSILVKQYVESLAAFTYYETLKKISGSGSILSPRQPGYLYGNLKSDNNPSEHVLGYFDVASVSSKRIYFNYEDLFPGEFAPPYFTNCDEFCYRPGLEPYPCRIIDGLIQDIELQKVAYQTSNNSTNTYGMVNAPCGDCTLIGSNIKPPFWID